jgi:hypothetical protein
MPDKKPASGPRKPTGQEMDQEYDELHESAGEAIVEDEHPSPADERRAKKQDQEDYAEGIDLKDPD